MGCFVAAAKGVEEGIGGEKMTWAWGHLKPNHYVLIMADPAWHFRAYGDRTGTGIAKSAQAHYSTMPLDDIKALRVDLLADEHCVLWLWACNPMLDQAFDVMSAWGFRFSTAGSWEKVTSTGKQAFGTGHVLRSSNEPFLIGTMGNPKFSKRARSSFRGLVRGHSRKPVEAYSHAELMMKHPVSRVELFSRETAPGWDVWGDEAGKFDQENLRDRASHIGDGEGASGEVTV